MPLLFTVCWMSLTAYGPDQHEDPHVVRDVLHIVVAAYTFSIYGVHCDVRRMCNTQDRMHLINSLLRNNQEFYNLC